MNQFLRWLSGTFICKHCGREFVLNTFGFGEVICPQCYHGEETFIEFDETYYLNRLIKSFFTRRR